MRKTFSHENMSKKIQNAKITVISCALEPPKTRHTVNVNSAENFFKLEQVQNQDDIERIAMATGATICTRIDEFPSDAWNS
jgi:chaperonin GroEL (HSP60 family)